MEYVEAIRSYWENLDARIPKLSPKENDWLDNELASTDSVRWYSSRQSKENAIRMLHETISMCLSSVNDVLSSQKNQSDAQFEMLYWNRVLTCHMGYDIFADNLEQANLLENEKQRTENMLKLIASYINVKFVPSAMADIMDWKLVSK
ncbi:hypothetical protein ABMA46_18000 [Mesorhizobium sp. CN5-321]|uniref:hypothetical protein n=1 Tax=Mesorhizobium hunchu TaxID=3157708 RepID=UPI0032B7478E